MGLRRWKVHGRGVVGCTEKMYGPAGALGGPVGASSLDALRSIPPHCFFWLDLGWGGARYVRGTKTERAVLGRRASSEGSPLPYGHGGAGLLCCLELARMLP